MRRARHGDKWVTVKMHRIILVPPARFQIDHIDHNGLNNQKSNLRICTHGQNQMNKYYPSATGLKGVYKDRAGRFRVTIESNGRKFHIGMYNTSEEAALAYNEAARKYHKEFAWLNKI
jgi:hypothetical protein